jgi:hypothetical protein
MNGVGPLGAGNSQLAITLGNMGNLHPSLPVWYKNQQ